MASVLQVCTYYNPLGGIESAIRELVTGIRGDCDVEVLCTKKGPGNSVDMVDGVKITSLGSLMSVTGRPLAHQMPLELLKSQADIMHYHIPFPLGVMSHLVSRPKARMVATFHCDIVRYAGFKQVFEPFLQLYLKACDAILVTSPHIIEATPVLDRHRNKCHVVPYGVDPSRFQQPRHDKIASLKQRFGSPFILFVGRLAYYKGLDVLIKSMKLVDAPLVIVGNGELEDELRNLAIQEGVDNRVHFLGGIYDESLVDLYHACDVFALPSTSSAEAFGLVQVEAMMAGKPVVNTSLETGVPFVSLHGQTGLTVPPSDVMALADALNTVLQDDALRASLGRQAKHRALERFTSQRYVSNVLSVYEQLMEQESGCGVPLQLIRD